VSESFSEAGRGTVSSEEVALMFSKGMIGTESPSGVKESEGVVD
jgi:hypothetical protein